MVKNAFRSIGLHPCTYFDINIFDLSAKSCEGFTSCHMIMVQFHTESEELLLVTTL